ncbi:Protein of unknown function DUF58 [Colwellia chukchiensis]|uniref:DUF58 domain-containing protein n=1 Tax=Colwellia chukchiensis TaxID=641665 RepID=A0A1H7H5B9_9GAMM|nr:DUF58 domain-containing protein [Colwellia chukchiensis]SEK45484.1 Protein of unknown function DUF58 [Colwellia chukchiensis]
MWFKQKNSNQQSTPQQVLDELLSNGISLTIDELMRYQNKSSLINLAAAKSLRGKMSGNYLARSKGRGMEFDEVRHYQNGDDIRAIDWRVTARTGKTHTKLFREEVERPVLIATDLSTNMLFGSQLLFKSVQAAHVAALVAWHAKSRGDRIGGVVFNQQQHTELKPRSRQQGVLHYLHALVQCHAASVAISQSPLDHQQAQLAFSQNCTRLRQIAKPGSLVYLLTDAYSLTDDAVRHLSRISQHCELVICLLSDPLEQQLPETSEKITVSVTNGHQRQQLTLGDQALAEKYHQQALQLTDALEQKLTTAGARLLHFCASEALEIQLHRGVASWIR